MDPQDIERLARAWALHRHPIRPSREEVEFMRARTGRKPKPRVLALGATPEMVDLAFSVDAARVTVMELRPEAGPAMRLLATRDWSGVEFIVDDWRNHHPKLDGQFDIVLGHGSLLFMPYPHDWVRLLTLCRDYLVADGIQIQRTPLLPPEGHSFRNTYSRYLAKFEATAGQTPEARLDAFCFALSNLRQSAWLDAASAAGGVDRERYRRNVAWLAEDLARRYRGQSFWETAAADMTGAEAPGYAELPSCSAPPWEAARPLFAACGLAAERQVVGNCPGPNCNSVITAVRRQPAAPHAPSPAAPFVKISKP